MNINSKPAAGSLLVDELGQATEQLQPYLDDLEGLLNRNLLGLVVQFASYTVAGVPDASDFEGAMIYVSDETGGATMAFSNGGNWRRVQDRAIIS